ncbi:hypothetical protein TNCV_2758191 [Trichonephila clavipes]|nr:hypothetical protein TNCV_2758191 [Trichonephila clavipes]
MLGRRIAAHQPTPTCLPELRRAWLDEWCNIPHDQIDNLILSALQCRFKQLSGSGRKRSTGPLGTVGCKELLDPDKSSLSGLFRAPDPWRPPQAPNGYICADYSRWQPMAYVPDLASVAREPHPIAMKMCEMARRRPEKVSEFVNLTSKGRCGDLRGVTYKYSRF